MVAPTTPVAKGATGPGKQNVGSKDRCDSWDHKVPWRGARDVEDELNAMCEMASSFDIIELEMDNISKSFKEVSQSLFDLLHCSIRNIFRFDGQPSACGVAGLEDSVSSFTHYDVVFEVSFKGLL